MSTVSSVSSGVVNGSWTARGQKGKSANDAAFQQLDSAAQASIEEAVNGKAYMSMKKILANLQADGVSAVKGTGSNGEAYLEVTNKDGSKVRIWDVGGDGGIGTQDLSFSNAVNNVANDVAKSTTAMTDNLVNTIDPSNAALFSNTEKETSTFSNTENKTSSSSSTTAEDKALIEQIKEMLKKQGTADELLDSEAEKLLPYYKTVHIA